MGASFQFHPENSQGWEPTSPYLHQTSFSLAMVLMMTKIQVAEWKKQKPYDIQKLEISCEQVQRNCILIIHAMKSPLPTPNSAWLGRISALILPREAQGSSLERPVQFRNTDIVFIRKTINMIRISSLAVLFMVLEAVKFLIPYRPHVGGWGAKCSTTSWIQSGHPIVWNLIKCLRNKAQSLSILWALDTAEMKLAASNGDLG